MKPLDKAALIELLHSLSIEDVGRVQTAAEWYLSMWFGFNRGAKADRTPEWVERARWRLEGKTEPCCECGADYPTVDLHFHGHIYCPKCRESEGTPP